MCLPSEDIRSWWKCSSGSSFTASKFSGKNPGINGENLYEICSHPSHNNFLIKQQYFFHNFHLYNFLKIHEQPFSIHGYCETKTLSQSIPCSIVPHMCTSFLTLKFKICKNSLRVGKKMKINFWVRDTKYIRINYLKIKNMT